MAFPLEETGIGLEDDFFAVAAKRSAYTSINKRGKDRVGMAIVSVLWFHVSIVSLPLGGCARASKRKK